MNRASGLHASLGSQTTPPVDPSLARQQRSPGSWFQGAEPMVVGVRAGTERCEDGRIGPTEVGCWIRVRGEISAG